MKLIIIFGPMAVGKMTVGHELEKITDLKLFHNHMTIELVSPFFSYGSDTGRKLVKLFRKEIFEEVAKSDLEGLIFTYVWAFDQQSDWDYVDEVCNIFESKGGVVYFAELEADVNERIERNKHPHRLKHKPTKRNLERSEKSLKEYDVKFRMNSKNGEIKRENYVRIDNTNLSPEETAQKIKEKFQL
ncbi:AAA family ATPase [Candidatus Nomurabacteria bacterium]|nr:AAA family ATPase [Candidatus Nomurabacteria bacterium]